MGLLVLALALAACGSTSTGEQAATGATAQSGAEGASATDAAAGKDGSAGNDASAGKAPASGDVPEALAANRAQANQILDEGSLDSKLAELKGHPVVVNQWASWCPPCRAEFPYFQDSAEQHAADVAFVGIDMQDERAAAEQFLGELPIPYPSVDDPSASAIGSLGGGIVSPTTVFIDANGKIVKVFQGAYTSQDQLEQDISKNLKV